MDSFVTSFTVACTVLLGELQHLSLTAQPQDAQHDLAYAFNAKVPVSCSLLYQPLQALLCRSSVW
jgi:hypothetical protein